MELQKKIEKWLEDEKFVTFANKRMQEEILYVPETTISTLSTRNWRRVLTITTVMQHHWRHT